MLDNKQLYIYKYNIYVYRMIYMLLPVYMHQEVRMNGILTFLDIPRWQDLIKIWSLSLWLTEWLSETVEECDRAQKSWPFAEKKQKNSSDKGLAAKFVISFLLASELLCFAKVERWKMNHGFNGYTGYTMKTVVCKKKTKSQEITIKHH